MSSRRARWTRPGAVVLVVWACAAPREPSGTATVNGGTGGTMGDAAPGAAGAPESMGGSRADSEVTSPTFTSPPSQVAPLGSAVACARETLDLVVAPVALSVLLDSSGSMQEMTPGGVTKWTAVEQALRSFAADPASARHSMSLQFFPLLKPGSSYTCTSHDDCGPDGGPCFLSTCLLGDTIELCVDDADCPGDGNACVTFGLCEDSDPIAPTACVLGSSCANGLGRCNDFERSCTRATECQAASYAVPGVPMGPVAEQLGPIGEALSAQVPQGLTPTAPALEGALSHARQWTDANPELPAVVVLATDGLPTDCESNINASPNLDDVLAVAGAGLAGSPPVRTFVIGVLEANQVENLGNLDAIAMAGGTERALLVLNGDDLSSQFTRALASVGQAGAVCHFELPRGSSLDYSRMEVSLRAASGATTAQPFVLVERGCTDSPDGWYFEENADTWQVMLCPELCSSAKAAEAGALSVAVGCVDR